MIRKTHSVGLLTIYLDQKKNPVKSYLHTHTHTHSERRTHKSESVDSFERTEFYYTPFVKGNVFKLNYPDLVYLCTLKNHYIYGIILS